MTPEDDGILRRWARRKRIARARTTAEPEPPLEIPPAAETIDLAEIAGWLKRNVPPAWKTAALRRLWVADPAIRNFVGMADYAWDWNTPGGAPGFGPLRAVDDVASLLQRLVAPAEPAGLPGPEEGAPDVTAPPRAVAPPRVAQPAPAPAVEVPDLSSPDTPLPRRRGGKATPV